MVSTLFGALIVQSRRSIPSLRHRLFPQGSGTRQANSIQRPVVQLGHSHLILRAVATHDRATVPTVMLAHQESELSPAHGALRRFCVRNPQRRTAGLSGSCHPALRLVLPDGLVNVTHPLVSFCRRLGLYREGLHTAEEHKDGRIFVGGLHEGHVEGDVLVQCEGVVDARGVAVDELVGEEQELVRACAVLVELTKKTMKNERKKDKTFVKGPSRSRVDPVRSTTPSKATLSSIHRCGDSNSL